MNTKIRSVNDAFLSISENMGKKDAFTRYLLTAALIGILLAVPPVLYLNPITIAANYLFTTALMRWDPVYSLLGISFAYEESSVFAMQIEAKIRHDLGVRAFDGVANDSHHSSNKLKKAG